MPSVTSKRPAGSFAWGWRRILGAAAVAILLCLPRSQAGADDLARVLPDIALNTLVPGADAAGPVEGDPPAAPVLRRGRQVGLILLTSDVVASSGYSGKPVKIAVGLDLSGKITGAAIVEHHEPILVLGIGKPHLDAFLEQFRGFDLRRPVRVVSEGEQAPPGSTGVHMVTGASITSLVFSDGIVRAARLVARSRGLIGDADGPGLDIESFREADWESLVRDGSVRHLTVTAGDVAARLGEEAGAEPERVMLDIFLALVTPAAIGQNLFGFQAHSALLAGLPDGSHVIMVAGGGAYSFKGYTFARTGVFDRLQVVQGERTIRLRTDMYRPVEAFAATAAPEVRDIGLFILGPDSGFDPVRPWRVDVMVDTARPDGSASGVAVPFEYQVPASLIRAAAPVAMPAEPPLWRQRWEAERTSIVILGITLAVVLAILFLHDGLARRPRIMQWLRPTLLLFTLVYLGWTVNAQLSVLNVLTVVGALINGFQWDFFLMEPTIFILWCFVAVTVLFWGRGVFCGWLCPFGAMQELLHRLAIAFGVAQIRIPYRLHERLLPLKYFIFLGLVAVALGIPSWVEILAEVEPFKTAIALKMMREGRFVFYALAIVGLSLHLERPFCRYLCPLGAGLAIASRNPMFDWLQRRRQCGTECTLCASRCPVQAVHANGQVDQHECIYCLSCQTLYHDDHKCPPLVARRRRREGGQQREDRP